MRHYLITISGKTYDVEVLDDPRKEDVRVRVDGEELTVNVELMSEKSAAIKPSSAVAANVPVATAPAPMAAAGGSKTIKSPLPGVVCSIKVRTGQKVSPNDELCVIEAMKAMNTIRATRAGTVGKIYVSEGHTIAYGAALMDIE
jgi:biotin carboxyl carrier protein